MIYCPTCGKQVQQTYQVPETEPFTATDPMLGLQVWGPYSAEKTILCQGRTWIHFQTNCEERLVHLGVPLTEPFGPDGYIEDDEDVLFSSCPNCDQGWGIEEISFQECDSCGYPHHHDDDDDDDHEWYYDEDKGDDDLPF